MYQDLVPCSSFVAMRGTDLQVTLFQRALACVSSQNPTITD